MMIILHIELITKEYVLTRIVLCYDGLLCFVYSNTLLLQESICVLPPEEAWFLKAEIIK